MTTSVIVVNFRAYDELERCLASLRAEGPAGTAVVVVDQEPDQAGLARLRQQYPYSTFVESPENRGFATGVNLAARHARGDCLLLLNPDCRITPEATARLASWLEAHPGVGAVGPRIWDPSGTVQASARRFPDVTTAFAGRSSWLTRTFPSNPLSRRNLPVPVDLAEPAEVDWVSGACMLVRREAFDEVGGMDERFFLYWEDADLGRRLIDAGWTTVYHPGVDAIHAAGASSRFVPIRSAAAFHRSALHYYRKHLPTFGALTLPFVAGGLAVRLALLLAWNYSREAFRLVFGGPSPAACQDAGEHVDRVQESAGRRGAA